MKYYILARKGDENFCDIIITKENMKEFCVALRVYHEAHGKFKSEPLTKIQIETNRIGSSYDINIIMPNILSMKKEMTIKDNSLNIKLTSSVQDRFKKIDGDLEKALELFTWSGIEHLDIQELGKILIKQGYLNAR